MSSDREHYITLEEAKEEYKRLVENVRISLDDLTRFLEELNKENRKK